MILLTDTAVRFYHSDVANYVELAHYGRLFRLEEFVEVPEEAIKSSGYVVDSLEAAVWSLITTDSFDKALLKAVNLGDDTDTVGAIAGGLAGLYYGYESMPKEWLESVIRREWGPSHEKKLTTAIHKAKRTGAVRFVRCFLSR